MRQSRGGSGVGNETRWPPTISMPAVRADACAPRYRCRCSTDTEPASYASRNRINVAGHRAEPIRTSSRPIYVPATIQYAYNTGIIGVGLVGSSCSRSNRSHQSPPLNSQARITPPLFDTLIARAAEIFSCFISFSLSLSLAKKDFGTRTGRLDG